MTAPDRKISFLASVRSEDEALLAVAEGADIIDCKEPLAGALGALSLHVVNRIRDALPAHIAVSATIGDLPCEPSSVVAAAAAMAGTGADYVKVGLWPGNSRPTVFALGREVAGRAQLVAVLFADLEPDFTLIQDLQQAGFAGVMLDTAGKGSGPLVAHLSMAQIEEFVRQAHGAGLFAGLAGSLRLAHVAGLRAAKPDVLGFRGALCANAQRSGELDPAAVRAIARAVGADVVEPAL